MSGWPLVTSTTRAAPASSAARTENSTSARPARRWSTFGTALFMRVPCPAASTMAVKSAISSSTGPLGELPWVIPTAPKPSSERLGTTGDSGAAAAVTFASGKRLRSAYTTTDSPALRRSLRERRLMRSIQPMLVS